MDRYVTSWHIARNEKSIAVWTLKFKCNKNEVAKCKVEKLTILYTEFEMYKYTSFIIMEWAIKYEDEKWKFVFVNIIWVNSSEFLLSSLTELIIINKINQTRQQY